MSNNHYQENLLAKRTIQLRKMLKSLPSSCSDFISSISLTTSILTRLAYVIDLNAFFTYLQEEIVEFSKVPPIEITDNQLATISVRDVIQYAEYLTLYFKEEKSKDGNSTTTKTIRNHESGVMRKLSSLRSFFDYMQKCERIPTNVVTMVTLPKLHEKPILYLVSEEVDRLLSITQNGEHLTPTQMRFHKLTRSRDIAILMLFLGTGIRVSECVGINIEDLDFTSNALVVTRKGGNQVVLYFPQEVADSLQNYLVDRNQISAVNGHENALFLSLQKKRLSNRAVQLMVKKYSALAVPLKRKMSPHKLRSTFATHLYHSTEDIYLVADVLGHTDINTTRKHYAAMSDKRRREAANNVHLPKTENNSEKNN